MQENTSLEPAVSAAAINIAHGIEDRLGPLVEELGGRPLLTAHECSVALRS